MTVDTAGSHAIGERKNTTTLPPIASLPSNSSKAKQLITNVQATPQPSISQYNSNQSDSPSQTQTPLVGRGGSKQRNGGSASIPQQSRKAAVMVVHE